MGLFEKKNGLVTIGNGIECYHIDTNNIKDLDAFYVGIENMYRIPAYAMQGNLIFGGNNYYNVIDGCLFLYHYNQNKVSLVTLPFNKDGKFVKFSEALSYMKNNNIYRIRCILDTMLRTHDNIYILKKYFTVKSCCNEYFYNNADIYEMVGNKFSKMRNKVNKFMKMYPNINYRWGKYEDKMLLLDIYNKWKTDWNGTKYPTIFDSKYFENILSLGCNYFLIFFDGITPIGFLGYYPSNGKNVHCGFRKLNINYQYLTQYAQVKFCHELLKKGYLFTNDDNDNNSKGLKEMKTSFQPIHIMKEYELILKDK